MDRPITALQIDFTVMYRFGSGVCIALALVSAAAGEPAWRTILLAIVGVGLGIPSILFRPKLRAAVYRYPILGSLIVFVAQGALISLTGAGISPALLILIPGSFAAGMAVRGRIRWAVMLIPLSIVLFFYVGTSAGYMDALVPSAFSFQPPLPWVVCAWCFVAFSIPGSFVFSKVVSDVVRANARETRAAQARSLELMRQRQLHMEAFTAGVAHELKGPLTAVQGLATTLARRATDGPARERHTMLVSQVHRLQQAVGDLLDVYRPIDPLSLDAHDARELVGECMRGHAELADQADVRLLLDVPEKPATATLDARKVRTVLVALLQNAIEASPPDEAVSVSLTSSDSDLTITIEDRGPGIDHGIRDRLFAPGVTTKQTGNGLGLFTSQFLVEQHGGELAITDGETGGCCVQITLPREVEVA